MVKEYIRGSRFGWAGAGSDEPISREHSHEPLVLEPRVQQLAHRSNKERSKQPAGAGRTECLLKLVHVRRRSKEIRFQYIGCQLHIGFKLEVCLHVSRAEALDLDSGSCGIRM